MRNKILGLVLSLILCPLIEAQSTTVSATVVDSSSQVWQNGSISYTFQGNGSFYGQYQWNGSNLPNQYLTPTVVSLNSSGVGSFSIPSSTAIYPAGSTWKLTICPNATFTCTTLNLSITGSTQDISTQVTAAISPPVIDIQTIPRAYADGEIRTALNQGGVYYNTGSSLTGLRYWNGSNFQPISGGSAGISSFIFTAPSPFSATGSPCSSTGCTVGFTVNTESQNTVFAGPTSGSGVPSFRALVANDIPALPYIPSSTNIYYQTLANNGTSLTQRPAINFGAEFTLTDDSSPAETIVDLNTVGTPGSVSNIQSITTDSKGRVSSIATISPTKTCTTGTTYSCYRLDADGTIEEYGIAGPIPSGADSGEVSIVFPYTLPNTNHLEINTNPTGCSGDANCGGDWVLSTLPIGSTVTTSGFTAYACSGNTPGGGGSNITASNLYIEWHIRQ